ncbi:DUF3450 domain-containing protein [Aurantivibrio plasticivorans]
MKQVLLDCVLNAPRLQRGLSKSVGVIVCTLVYSMSVSAFTFADVMAKEQETIAAGKQTQQQIDKIEEATATAVNQYRALLKQSEDLDKYNNQLNDILADQQQELRWLREEITRVNHLEQDIVPLMGDMIATLAQFVELDVPFLLEERHARVENLQQLMVSASASNAEKYRRILEAYQIENDYGRTIETWSGLITTNDTGERSVNFLKVGRLLYFYQTIDAKQSFLWDVETRQWLRLDSRYNREIQRAIKMANEQIPSDLLSLPLIVSRH